MSLFANVFADHAVLDASPSRPARVWGDAEPYDLVSISLDLDEATGLSAWRAEVEADAAAIQREKLSIKGRSFRKLDDEGLSPL